MDGTPDIRWYVRTDRPDIWEPQGFHVVAGEVASFQQLKPHQGCTALLRRDGELPECIVEDTQ